MIVEHSAEVSAIVPPAWSLGPEDRHQPAGRVFAMILDGQLGAARRHEAGVRSDPGPAHLHQYRVAVRRARSVLSAGGAVFPASPSRALSSSMKAVFEVSSGVRDLDVLIAAIEERNDSISAELHDGSALLLAALRLRRSTRFGELDSMLSGPGYASMVQNWQVLGSVYRLGGDEPGPDALTSTGEVVDAAVLAAFRQVRVGGRRAHSTDVLDEWHDLRKRLKRLRYLVVAFAPLYPDGSLDPAVRNIRRLQNVLGRLQDHATEVALIESVGAAMGGRAALAAGALSEQLHRATERDRERCLGAWARFDHRSTRGMLRSAISSAD